MTARQRLIEMAASHLSKHDTASHDAAHESLEHIAIHTYQGETKTYYQGISQHALDRLIIAVVTRSQKIRSQRHAATP